MSKCTSGMPTPGNKPIYMKSKFLPQVFLSHKSKVQVKVQVIGVQVKCESTPLPSLFYSICQNMHKNMWIET